MICFYCGADVGDEHRCHRCGADILLYKQIIYTSDVFYNQGLDKARVKDISGAIEALKTSLQYHKYNTKARNLLGLCYYQIGELAKALDEWIISKNLQPEDNPNADRYLAEIENNPGLMNKMNSTVKKYNQALEYCRAGSRDLAMIQLKKVISQNPNLVSARQLLSLLYIQEEKYADARKELLAANKIDCNNTITQRYMSEVKQLLKDASTGKKKKKSDVVTFNDGNDTIIMSENSFRSLMDNSRSSFGNILLGLIVGILICYFLISPTVAQGTKEEQTKSLLALNETLSASQQEVISLQSEVDKLKENLDEYENRPDIATSYENMFRAMLSYEEGDTNAACDAVGLVNVDILGENGKAYYDKIYGTLKPYVLENFYNEGNGFYLEQNYESAITNLKNVVELEETYKDGAALFLLADCYRLTGDNESAIINYNRVVELFPNSEWGKQAKTYIAAGGANVPSGDGEAAEVAPSDEVTD